MQIPSVPLFAKGDKQATDVFRLIKKPKKVIVDRILLKEHTSLDRPGWVWEEMIKGGVLRIKRKDSAEVKTTFKP